MPVALESVADLVEKSDRLQQNLKRELFVPDGQKVLDKLYSVSEVGRMVGRTPQAIREAEKESQLPQPTRNPDNNRRIGYTLSEVNDMRNHFGTRLSRNRSEDESVVLAIQNFKGGVGKSTISTHLSQFMARAGLRVLLIDCDSQASATKLFGFTPDVELTDKDTLEPFFSGSQRGVRYAIRKTVWDGLDIIPANLTLYGAEYSLAARMRSDSPAWLTLREGIAEIKNDYDVIIIDPPPALGMISLNVMYAATGIIVPMVPGMLDFMSTIQFFTMLREVLETLENADKGPALEYDFIKILVSRKGAARTSTDTGTSQDDITMLARDFYGSYMMNSVLYASAEIENALAAFRTVYELERPISSSKTHKRAVEILDAVGNEVLTMIRETWPSHQRTMARELAGAI